MTPRGWTLIAATCAVIACTEDRKKIQAVPSGPNTGETISSDGGGGSKPNPDEDDSGKAVDAGSPVTYCTRVTVPAGGVEDNPIATFIKAPGDFTLTRQVERWSNDCDDPKLMLEFSDGKCPFGSGHSLTFTFSYRALVDGVLHGGNNMVGADKETPALSVRYTRPKKKLEPYGLWGTCEAAEGQLIFAEAPVPQAGKYLTARFQLSLTKCGEVSDDKPQFVEGAFHLLLRTSLSDACPPDAGVADGAGGRGGFDSGAGGDTSTSFEMLNAGTTGFDTTAGGSTGFDTAAGGTTGFDLGSGGTGGSFF
jgi:hypothetical protein